VDTCDFDERRYWFLGDYDGGRGGASEIGDALRRAVERQLRSAAPVGLFLSGGMDSSAVAALACEIATGPVRTFNVGFADTELDESPYARAVARALGTDHTEIRIQQDDFEVGLEDWLCKVDQPTFDGLNTFLVSRAVRDAGIRVALGGTGGDDLFGGNRTFREIPFVAKWARNLSGVPEPLLRAAAQIVTRLKTGKGTVPHQTRWGKLSDVLTTRGNLLELYQLTYALFTPEFIGHLLTNTGSSQLRVGIPRSYAEEIEAAVSRNSEMYAISLMEIVIFLGERLLRDLNCASQSVGLEVRAPFLDDSFVEVWRGTSPKTSYEPVGTKKVLIDTALSGMDPSLFDRPKAGFVLPIDKWCRDRFGDTVAEAFANADHCRAVGIDPETAQRLWIAFKRADSGLYWSRIWSIFVYLRLCEREGLELEVQP
jgi:asparagine synthase (glutamine-hydrolysing)